MRYFELFEDEMVDEILRINASDWNLTISDQLESYNGKKRKFFGKIDDIAVYLVILDDNHRGLILMDGEDGIGYAVLSRCDLGWFIISALMKDYWGRNIGYRLYCLLLDKGYVLISGDEQTRGSEILWKKLISSGLYDVRKVINKAILSNGDDFGRIIVPLDNDIWNGEMHTRLIAAKRGLLQENFELDGNEIYEDVSFNQLVGLCKRYGECKGLTTSVFDKLSVWDARYLTHYDILSEYMELGEDEDLGDIDFYPYTFTCEGIDAKSEWFGGSYIEGNGLRIYYNSDYSINGVDAIVNLKKRMGL